MLTISRPRSADHSHKHVHLPRRGRARDERLMRGSCEAPRAPQPAREKPPECAHSQKIRLEAAPASKLPPLRKLPPPRSCPRLEVAPASQLPPAPASSAARALPELLAQQESMRRRCAPRSARRSAPPRLPPSRRSSRSIASRHRRLVVVQTASSVGQKGLPWVRVGCFLLGGRWLTPWGGG